MVYEVEEPAWGGIGALTQVDHIQARAYARKLIEQGQMTTGPYCIALYGDNPEPLDRAVIETPMGAELKAEPAA
jgi:hypothetical protein